MNESHSLPPFELVRLTWAFSKHDKDGVDLAHLLHCLPIQKTQTSQRFCTDLARSLATHSFC